MSFLNSEEQTLLGVILTMTVLCIFAGTESGDSNNFIFRLLSQQWNKYEGSLSRISDTIKNKLERFQGSERYKRLSKKVYAGQEYNRSYLFALQLLMRFKDATNDIKTDSSPSRKILDKIKRSNEQTRAPLFTLMFGLLLLTINMIAGLCGESVNVVLPGIWIFTILSIIYWSALWLSLFARKIGEKDVEDDSDDAETFWKKCDRNNSWLILGFYKILICSVVASLLLYVIDVTQFTPIISFIIVASLLFLVILVIGVWRVKCCEVKGNYSVIHIIGHIAAFIFYAAVIGAIYHFLGQHVCDSLLTDSKILGCTIVLFALINGIVCPFALPYLRYRKPYKDAMSELQRWDCSLDIAIKLFNGGYSEWEKVNNFEKYMMKDNATLKLAQVMELYALNTDPLRARMDIDALLELERGLAKAREALSMMPDKYSKFMVTPDVRVWLNEAVDNNNSKHAVGLYSEFCVTANTEYNQPFPNDIVNESYKTALENIAGFMVSRNIHIETK